METQLEHQKLKDERGKQNGSSLKRNEVPVRLLRNFRARGKTAAAEFFETVELSTPDGDLSFEDAWIIAQHIEVSDADIDDSWLPSERYGELVSESVDEIAANVQRVIEGERLDG